MKTRLGYSCASNCRKGISCLVDIEFTIFLPDGLSLDNVDTYHFVKFVHRYLKRRFVRRKPLK